MKTNKFTGVLKILTILALGVLLQACGKNEDKSGNEGRVVGTATTTTAAGAPVVTTACGANDKMIIGRLYDDTKGAMNPTFSDQLKNFISGFTSPTGIGYVSGIYYDNTRVEFTGSLKFDAQGNVIPAQTQIKLLIFDNNSINSNSPPFTYQMLSASDMVISGTVNRSNGNVDVKFEDSYGVVTLTAQYDATFLSGYITFNNKKSYDGSALKSGRLGAFYISSCAIM